MECLLSVAGSVASPIVKYAVKPIVRQFGYLFSYKRNIQSLRDEVKRLDDQISGVQLLVDDADRNSRDPMPSVKTWLEEARGTSEEIGQFLESEPARVDKGCCLNGWCPNPISRYTISRKAKKKTPNVVRLFENGNFPADRIAAPAQPPRLVHTLTMTTRGFQDFESRVMIMDKVMEALKKDDGVNLIRICGPGGVGKTTMVTKILNRVRGEKLFDEAVMAVVSQTPDSKKIQDAIADQLGLKFDEQSQEGRAAKLHERIVRANKFLLVLDDVWEELPFADIGLPSVASRGYKILFTSRSVGAFLTSSGDNRKPANFEVPNLLEEEAMQLFKKSAGDCCEDPDISLIANQVVKECGGVPIAIVTVGNVLRAAGSSKSEWRDALNQLKSGNHGERVETCIKLSYNYLKCEEQKGFFLLCCLFPEDADIPIETLLRYGMGIGLLKNDNYSIQNARDRVHTLVGQLRRLFLLLESEKPQHVRMHDIVRDVGISIGSKDQDHGVMSTCKYYQKSDQVSGLTKLKLLWLSELQSDVGLNFFDGMKKLNVLALLGGFEGPSKLPPFQFQGLKNIQTLCLEGYDLSNIDLSAIGELESLEILSFYGSSRVCLPSKLGLLTRLRLLDCTCDTKISYGVLSGLKQLENLYLGGDEVKRVMVEEGKEAEDTGFAEFRCLSSLTTLAITLPYPHLIDPKDWHFEKLKQFHICLGCCVFQQDLEEKNYEFPNRLDITVKFGKRIEQGMASLINTLLKETEILNVHENLSVAVEEEEKEKKRMKKSILKYDYFETLSEEEEEGGCLISDYEAEENLFDLLGLSWKKGFRGGSSSLSHLQSLEVSGCHSLKYVLPFNMLGDLLQLKILKVSKCRRIEEVFHLESSWGWEGEGAGAATITIITLPQLTKLKLEYLPKLTALSKSKVTFVLPQLMTLVMRRLKNLKSVWTSTPLSSNTEPIGSHFTLLPTEDDWTKQFQNLRVLKIEKCPEVEVLFEFVKLEYATNSILPQLQQLYIANIPKLKHVWKNGAQASQGFQNLQLLRVCECGNMEHVIGREGEEEDKEGDATVLFPQLARLQLSNLRELVSFFSENKYTLRWKSMNHLRLEQCPNMKTFISSGNIVNDTSHVDHYLFDEDVDSVELRTLYISDIACENIWHCKTQVSVEQMTVSNCHKLKNVLATSYSCGGIKMVKLLDVYKCDSLGVVFQFECDQVGTDMDATLLCNGNGLRELDLYRLPKLKHIWNISSCGDPHLTIQLQAAFTTQLKKLQIEECPGLHCVARSVVVFPKLYHLTIRRCRRMSEIFGNDDEATTSTSINITTLLPNLARLELKANENLESIVKGMDADDNIATQLSLQHITIVGCLKLGPSSSYSLLNNLQLKTARIEFANQQVEVGSKIMSIDGVEKLMDMLILDVKSTPPQYLSDTRSLALKNLLNFPAAALWHFLQSLPNLVKLDISSCGSTEVIFGLDQGLINPKKLPQLTELKLTCLEKLTCVWMKGIPRELSQRFRNLRKLHVGECHSLRNLLTLSMLKHLPNLTTVTVENCRLVEEICVEDEGEEINNETVEFPQLLQLTLTNLPNLTSFCADAHEVFAFNWSSLSKVFVSNCPRLETFILAVSNTPKLMKGIPRELSQRFQNLRELHVGECHGLRNLFTLSMLKHLPNLTTVTVENCRLVEEICVEDEGEEINNETVEFPQLLQLTLTNLPNLTSFCADAHEVYAFNWSSLTKVFVSDCPRLETFILAVSNTPKLMKGIPRELSQRFQNLRELYVKECHGLRNLFTLSMVKHLACLTTLTVENCRLVNEICVADGGEEISTGTIIFPQVKKLTFINLPELMIFCNTAQVQSFKWPSLTEVVVNDCPRLWTFTGTFSSTPKLDEVDIQHNKLPLMEDLNTTIQLTIGERSEVVIGEVHESSFEEWYYNDSDDE